MRISAKTLAIPDYGRTLFVSLDETVMVAVPPRTVEGNRGAGIF